MLFWLTSFPIILQDFLPQPNRNLQYYTPSEIENPYFKRTNTLLYIRITITSHQKLTTDFFYLDNFLSFGSLTLSHLERSLDAMLF